MTKEEKENLFERYLNNQCTPEERRLIDQWFEQHHQAASPLSEEDSKRLALEIMASIEESTQLDAASKKQNFAWLSTWQSFAAALLLFTSLAFLLFNRINTVEPDKSVSTAEYFAFQTPAGQKATLTLPDSSVIWLNGNTAIRYKKSFDDTERLVFLERGEAFFEVRRNPARPFVVSTEGFRTQVLGTSFNIEVANHLNEYKMTVSSGKVAVINDSRKMDKRILVKGQQLVYSRKNDQCRTCEVQPEDFSAWRQNELILNDASWAEIARRLEAWYGVEVTLKIHKGTRETFTGRFENPSLDEVLTALKKINEFHYFKDGKEVIITDK